MHGADFDESNQFALEFDDPMGELLVCELFRDDGIRINFGEEVIEVFLAIKRSEGFDEGVPAELGEGLEILKGRSAKEHRSAGAGRMPVLRFFGGLELLKLDIAEPDGLAFCLEGDVSVGELEWGAGGEKFLGRNDSSLGVKLRLFVAQDFLAVHAVNDLLVSSYFDFDLHPLVGRDGRGGGFHNVLCDELAVHFEVGAGGADVAGGAFAFSFVSEELKLKTDGEALVESHALWWLRVNHDAAVQVHVAGSINHHLAGELILHAEDVMGVGEI